MMEGVASEAASLAAHLSLPQPVLDLRQQPHDHRGHDRHSPSPRMSPPASSRMAGTSPRSPTPTTRSPLDRASRIFLKTNDRPTLILVHSHIGYGAPTLQDTTKAHGEPLGEEELRGAKEFYGFGPDTSSSSRTPCRSTSPPPWARAARRRMPPGTSCWRAYRGAIRTSPTSSMRSTPARCRRLGVALPSFPADAKGLATRDSSGKVLNALAQRIPWIIGGAADLSPCTKTQPDVRGRRQLRGRTSATTTAATCISASASTPWAPRERHGFVRAERVRLRLPDLHRLRRALDPAVGADGAVRSSISGRTTPSAWARTARRTSRSSSCCRCARYPAWW